MTGQSIVELFLQRGKQISPTVSYSQGFQADLFRTEMLQATRTSTTRYFKTCLVSLHSETCSSNLKTSMASFSSPLSSQANYVQAYGTRHTQQCQMLQVHKLQTCRKGSHWLKHCGCSVQVCDWQKTSKFPRRNTTESSHAPSTSLCTSFRNTRDLL